MRFDTLTAMRIRIEDQAIPQGRGGERFIRKRSTISEADAGLDYVPSIEITKKVATVLKSMLQAHPFLLSSCYSIFVNAKMSMPKQNLRIKTNI